MATKTTNNGTSVVSAQFSKRAEQRTHRQGSRVTQERAKAQRAKLDAQAKARHAQEEQEEREAVIQGTQTM